MRSVARGRTNKDIAAELGISEQGVKVHISRLLERYGAENRVELVAVTGAWQEADEHRYADLSSDIAGIRAGLAQMYRDATALGAKNGGNGHAAPTVTVAPVNGHSAAVTNDLGAEVRSLREVLTEINVALKLARELPADANVGPLVDAIRSRVDLAMERSARLDALVAERVSDHGSRQTAS